MSETNIVIDGESLTFAQVELIAAGFGKAVLSDKAKEKIIQSRKLVENILNEHRAVYGITTGFGKFKDVYIKPEDSRQLQENLIVSHAAGVGPNFARAICRAMMLLRANALAKGFSGVRLELIETLLDCLNKGVHPCIPEQGSLGASGDLAPLAHLALVLIGRGQAEFEGQTVSGGEALAKAGIKPITLEAKEGLALLNGTQAMAALGCLTIVEADYLAKVADIVGCMSLEAQLGSATAFSAQIQEVRPHAGQISSAKNLRLLMQGSELAASHVDCPMVQDAYSLRCMPQVHGASRDAFSHAAHVFGIEINSATDNPLVFADGILSGGNFHGQPLALVSDYLTIALCELANISERRVERLVNPALSNGLPAFLTEFGGLNSGYMVAQYTAASLVSENKALAHPASVDSIPTSANQEDHVSMGTIAARKARQVLNNVYKVLAIELLCAAQGLDLRLKSINGGNTLPGPAIAAAHKLVRSQIRHLDQDRELYADINQAETIIRSQELLKVVEALVGKLD